jgi:hypothetical protein
MAGYARKLRKQHGGSKKFEWVFEKRTEEVEEVEEFVERL